MAGFRVARFSRKQQRWRLTPGTYDRPEAARMYAGEGSPPGYVVEIDKCNWPMSVRWCTRELARTIIHDLTRAGDVMG